MQFVPPAQILHNYYFQFLLGLIIVPWEIENYTFWGGQTDSFGERKSLIRGVKATMTAMGAETSEK